MFKIYWYFAYSLYSLSPCSVLNFSQHRGCFQTQTFLHKTTPCYDFFLAANFVVSAFT
jgi:hypothetical protein